MVNCGVLFEVWAEFLNLIWTSFVYKGLSCSLVTCVLGSEVDLSGSGSSPVASFGFSVCAVTLLVSWNVVKSSLTVGGEY
jgi:hypothetical protein